MQFDINKYLSKVGDCEEAKGGFQGKSRGRKKKNIDGEYLVRVSLTWLVGAIVSLIPMIFDIYINSKSICDFVKGFFSNKDLFLVVTTLTISVVLEMAFVVPKSNAKNLVISIAIILIVISIYLCSLLQTDVDVPYITIIGMGITALCILDSIGGYYISSKKEVATS